MMGAREETMPVIVKVAAIQMAPVIGEVAGNVERAAAMAAEAARQGAKLICLPELFNTGYFCHTSHCDPAFFELAEPVDGFTMRTFQQLAADCGVYVTVPFFEREREGLYYNSCSLINDRGEVAGVYRKTHVPWSRTGWEKFYMRPGYDYPVFDTPYGRIGMLICYDRDFPEAARTLGLKGADLIVIANGAPAALIDVWKSIVQVRAYENQLFVLGACLTGQVDEEHHDACGHSILATPRGQIAHVLGREEAALIADIDYGLLREARRERYLYRDRRPEMYGKVTTIQ